MAPHLKTPIIIASAILIVGGATTAFVVSRVARKPTVTYQAAAKGNLVRAVTLTGSVKPTEDVDLAFERGGRISRVNVDVGASVVAGQVLATIDASDLNAQLAQANAASDVAKAHLLSLQSGLRPQESALQNRQVGSAADALTQAQTGLIDKLTSAYAAADDAVRGKADQFFSAPTGQNPHLTLFVPDTALVSDLEWNRLLTEQHLVAWDGQIAELTNTADLHAAADAARTNLSGVNAFLAEAALAVDKTTIASNPDLSDATLALYKSNLSLARTAIAGASASVTAAEQQLKAAESGVNVAQAQSDLKNAGASTEDIAGAEASVRQADAAADAVRVQIAKTMLRAPFDGVVTKNDAHVGATASANATVFSVISNSAFEIKAQASELDVADLHQGDAATVTLDAYGTGVPFQAEIASVDPAGSADSGVVSYTVTLRFKDQDPRIKSGMTANVSVNAGTRTDVVVVPSADVMLRDNKSFVLVEGANGPESQEVTVGLHGSDGNVEILTGLKEGERYADFGSSGN